MLTILWSAVATHVLRDFTSYEQKRNIESSVDGSVLSIERRNAWVANVLYYVVEMKRREEYWQKNVRWQVCEIAEDCNKAFNWGYDGISKTLVFESVIVEDDGLSSWKRINLVIEISRFATVVWTVPSVKRMFISVQERSSLTYVTGTIRALSDCCRGQVLDNCHIGLLGASTEWYATYDWVEPNLLLLGRNNHRRCVEDQGFFVCRSTNISYQETMYNSITK